MLSTQFHKFFIGQSWRLPSSPVCFVSQHVPSPLQFLTAFVMLLSITPCIHPAANGKGEQIGTDVVDGMENCSGIMKTFGMAGCLEQPNEIIDIHFE